MKTATLINILHGITEILELYPDKDVEDVIEDIKEMRKKYLDNISREATNEQVKDTNKKRDDADIKMIINELLNNIDSTSIEELDEKLNNTSLFPSVAYIRYFADKLGVSLSSRQNRINAIHSIKNYLDRMRIDKTISKRNEC